MPRGARLDCGTFAGRRQNERAANRVDQSGAEERETRKEDEQSEPGRDRRKAKEVEPDVTPEERIGLADRHGVQRHEHGHPLRRGDERGHQRHEQRTRQQQTGNDTGEIHRRGTDSIHVERGHPACSLTTPSDVPIQERERDDARDDEKQCASDERCEEDRFEANLVVPEPVGREAGERRHHEENEEPRGEEAEHDAP